MTPFFDCKLSVFILRSDINKIWEKIWGFGNIDSGSVFSRCVCVCRCNGYCMSIAMASLTSSSCRSSSSYRSSARYSTSSSYRSEGSLGGSSDSLDPLFEPFLDSADHSSLFGEEGPGGPSCLAPFSRHSRSSYGLTGKKIDWAPSPLVAIVMQSQLLLADFIIYSHPIIWINTLAPCVVLCVCCEKAVPPADFLMFLGDSFKTRIL